jgi:hypothetical protein
MFVHELRAKRATVYDEFKALAENPPRRDALPPLSTLGNRGQQRLRDLIDLEGAARRAKRVRPAHVV